MKTHIKYIDNISENISNCGQPLVIELSSYNLNWEGILIEKGYSPYFYPNNVITPYFYFALAIDSKFNWKIKDNNELKSLKTETGEIWINPPNTPFSHIIDEPCYFIILTVEEITLFKYFEGVLPKDKLQFLNNYNLIDCNLKYFIELFLNEVINKGKNGIQYIQNLLRLFSIYFIKNYSNYYDLIAQIKYSSIIDDRKLKLINEYINKNIESDISIDDLANLCKLSKFYFLKEFKKASGITPYQYIIKLKLEKAKELLKNERIIDITYQLGFSDQSHFTNSFKKYFGYPPGEYKSSE